MAKQQSPKRGINGKPWYWWVTHYECGPMPTARRRGRWYLYRCYGKRNKLLYVGSTTDLAKRFMGHRRESDWHQFVVRVVIVEFLDQASTRYAELQTIWWEMPAHNAARQQRVTDGWDEARLEDWPAMARPQKGE
jgi:GIY-YIG catalytic domain